LVKDFAKPQKRLKWQVFCFLWSQGGIATRRHYLRRSVHQMVHCWAILIIRIAFEPATKTSSKVFSHSFFNNAVSHYLRSMRFLLKFTAICNLAFWLLLIIHFNDIRQLRLSTDLGKQQLLSTILTLGLVAFFVNLVANLYTAGLLYKKQWPKDLRWLLIFNAATFVAQIVYLLS
jgi:hypothetical protein